MEWEGGFRFRVVQKYDQPNSIRGLMSTERCVDTIREAGEAFFSVSTNVNDFQALVQQMTLTLKQMVGVHLRNCATNDATNTRTMRFQERTLTTPPTQPKLGFRSNIHRRPASGGNHSSWIDEAMTRKLPKYAAFPLFVLIFIAFIFDNGLLG